MDDLRHRRAHLLIRRSELRGISRLSGSFNARSGIASDIDDRDSRGDRGGDRGEPLAVQPSAGNPAAGPGRDARHRAAGSLLVAPGQGQGTLSALHADALGLGSATLPARIDRVEDDPLDVCPRDDHSRAAAGESARYGTQGDTR